MGGLPTLLKLRALLLRRWLGQHAFSLFVLAPVPVAGALWVASRYLPILRDDLSPYAGQAAWIVVLVTIASLLPAALNELFPRRSADQLLDILPVSEIQRLHGALAGLVVRALPPALGFTLLSFFLADSASLPQVLGWAVDFWLVAVGLIPSLVLMAFALAAWRQPGFRVRRWVVLGGMLAMLVVALLAIPEGAARLAAPWSPAAQVAAGVLGEAMGGSAAAIPWLGLAVAAAIPYVTTLFVVPWRRRWLAGARGAPRGGLGSRLVATVSGWLSPPVAVQVRRDLLQVLRRFSPAVGLAFAASSLLLLAAWTALGHSALEPTARGRLALLASAAAVLPLSGLAPLLLARQLPRFWIERSSGMERQLVWRAKLWSARLLALPALLGGAWLVLAIRPATGWVLLLVLAELLVIVWMLSSILGIASFEIAEQPLVGLVFGSLIGLAVAGFLTYYRSFWIFGFAGYLYVFSLLGDRATARVWFMEADR